MRVTIKADGVTPEQLRLLCAALTEVGEPPATVSLDGPEKFKVETTPMQVNTWALVVTKLVRRNGVPLINLLNDSNRSLPRHIFYVDEHKFPKTPEANAEPTAHVTDAGTLSRRPLR